MTNEPKDKKESPNKSPEQVVYEGAFPEFTNEIKVKGFESHITIGTIAGSGQFMWPPGSIRLFEDKHFIETRPDIDTHEEHELTRQLISEKLAALPQREDLLKAKEEVIVELTEQINQLRDQLGATSAELAKSKELEEYGRKLCDQIKSENEATRNQLKDEVTDLKKYLSKFAPHKRFFRVTFGVLCFFSGSLAIYSLFGIKLVEPFWSVIGMTMSCAMLIVIYLGMKDNRQQDNSPAEHQR